MTYAKLMMARRPGRVAMWAVQESRLSCDRISRRLRMNDVASVGFGSLAIQGAFVFLAYVAWLLRHRYRVSSVQVFLLFGGGLACLITLGFPAGEILWRIGLSNTSRCLSEEMCRSSWLFCAKWIAISLVALAAQITFFAQSLPKRHHDQTEP